MNYNNDLPVGKQATKGDKQLTIIYYMDYSPLSNIRQLNEMGVADSLLGCVDLATILNMYVKKNNNNIIINARTGSCLEELYI